MPMINSKVTVSLPQEKRDILKAELGKAVAILGKPESYLMLGFEDNYDLKKALLFLSKFWAI